MVEDDNQKKITAHQIECQDTLKFWNVGCTHRLSIIPVAVIGYNESMQKAPYPAPDFILPDESGAAHSLADYRNQWVVLYFYPKDNTPGCTVEACSLRDARDTLSDLGAVVIGVSKDDAGAHEQFKAKHTLNFSLLTDLDGSVIQSYGAWGKKMYGREGILRKTFIIDPQGTIVKVYGRVTPLGHGNQIIADLATLQQA